MRCILVILLCIALLSWLAHYKPDEVEYGEPLVVGTCSKCSMEITQGMMTHEDDSGLYHWHHRPAEVRLQERLDQRTIKGKEYDELKRRLDAMERKTK